MMWLGAIAAVALASGSVATIEPAAQPGTPAWAEGADVVEHLGQKLPLDSTFVNQLGQRVALRQLFDGTHPVLLILAYYQCPQLCNLVIDSAAAAMQKLDAQGFRVGREYKVATVSFDASERLEQAAHKQLAALARLGRDEPATWPFFVGDDAAIQSLTSRLGFRFLRDPRTGALAHAAVVFVVTPDGVISRYLYGIDYAPRDLRLALLEASDGKTGSVGDRILMRCFQYDPATRRYGLFVARFMKIGGLAIFAIVVAMLSGFVRHEIRRSHDERGDKRGAR